MSTDSASGPRPTFLDDPILPPPPEGAVPVLHNRQYRIEAYYLANGRLLVQGALRDQKPPGVFIPDDPEPLTIHHMQIGIEISVPELIIEAVHTEFPTHPHTVCPSIIDHYDNLVGLSIQRGFTHNVRELFGGPRGCSHTTALIQALAPVAFQSLKSIECLEATASGAPHPIVERPQDDSWKRLTNTCHVWKEDGEMLGDRRAGGQDTQTIVVIRRIEELAEGPPSDEARS